MSKQQNYIAHEPDSNGYIDYSQAENDIWAELYARQLTNLPGRACPEYLAGLDKLALPTDRIPQLPEIDKVLLETTGWKTAAVPALISFGKFFELLANKSFPVATFIRSREEFDYLQEPDIFHEVFGHCPLLTNPSFAHFSHLYGQLGLAATKEQRVFLARLYWFTVEFGLVNEGDQLKVYGGGILSSPGETLAALSAEGGQREAFNINRVLRTPYRIDIMQPIYFVLRDIDQLYQLSKLDLMAEVERAALDGLYPPLFSAKEFDHVQ